MTVKSYIRSLGDFYHLMQSGGALCQEWIPYEASNTPANLELMGLYLAVPSRSGFGYVVVRDIPKFLQEGLLRGYWTQSEIDKEELAFNVYECERLLRDDPVDPIGG